MGGILSSTAIQGPALRVRDVYLQLKTVRPISPSSGAKNNPRFGRGTGSGSQSNEKKASEGFSHRTGGSERPDAYQTQREKGHIDVLA